MEAHKAIISNIFNNSTMIEVPFFQRAYVWKDDLWERFLDDMEYVTKSKKTHFLGSIILKEEKEIDDDASYTSCFTVIDGQQRLTTYLIFLKALCLKTNDQYFDFQFRINEEEVAFKHGRSDVEAFNMVTSLSIPEVIDNQKKSRIIDAYNYFIKNINPKNIDRKAIVKNIQFVKIELSKDEDEQQIFDSLNSLGVNLTTSELLKNYFFSRQTEKEYEDIWVKTFESDDDIKAYWDAEIETGRIKRAMIDIFFDAYFQIFVQDKKYNISPEDKISYDRLDQLAQSYQHFINNYCDGDKNIVLNQLKEYAECFRQSFSPDFCEAGIPKTYGIERMNVIIFGLKTSTLLPYLLYVMKNVSDGEEISKICEVLEGYLMRRMVVHATTKNYNRLFSSLILNSVTDAITLKDKLQKMNDATTYVPSDDELLDGFKKSKLANIQTKGIIYLIESRIRPESSAVALLGFNRYSLEHLMPKKWRNNWERCKTEEEARARDSKLLTLGNLAIITQSLNASIRDSDWVTKKAGKGKDRPGLDIGAAGLSTMHEVLQKSVWTVDDINDRADWLFEKAKETWDIVPDFENLSGGEGSDSLQKKALRKEYWEYALPIMQEVNFSNGMFSNCNPTEGNTIQGSFGIGGFGIACSANYDKTEIVFWLNSNNKDKNKEGFDLLFSKKTEIEECLKTELVWERADDYKASWIIHHLQGKYVLNREDWKEMAEYHAQMSNAILNACFPYLNEKYNVIADREKYVYVSNVSRKIRDCAIEMGIDVDIKNSNRTYIRFRTEYMSSLLPDTPDSLSGWNTPNHYFYEIRNTDGEKVYIQLALSSEGITENQRATADRMVELFPLKSDGPDWQWRLPFKTKKIVLEKKQLDDSIRSALSEFVCEIAKFEDELKNKL